MLFRAVLSLFILLASAASACNPFDPRGCKTQNIPQDQFYAGLSLGHTNLVGSLKRQLDIKSSDRVASLGHAGTTPGLFAGYGTVLAGTNIYAGAEAAFQHNNITIVKEENTWPSFVEYTTKLQKKDTLSLSGKLGFIHSSNVFYVKAGLASTRFSFSFEDRNSHVSQSGRNMRRTGILLGTGIDYAINGNWSIGAEYERTAYAGMKFSHPAVGKFIFSPKTYTWQVRLKYSF